MSTDSISASRRRFCQTTFAMGTSLAFAQLPTQAFATDARCSGITTPEEAFASSFVNVPEAFGPTDVAFSSPLPEGLTGTLYRNGPARMQRGDTRYNHWFDGDGMMHAFTLHPKHLVHKAKMVQTARSQEEEKAGRFLWNGFGTVFEDSRYISSADTVNVANTSVLPVNNELLALWEAGSPYRMHAETLETLGRHVFSPETDGLSFSAHPRVDPTGRIWNFGYLSGSGKLALYDLNPNGSLNRATIIDAPNADMVHDFAITEDYLVFLLPPLRFNANTAETESFADAFEWDGKDALHIMVIDKKNLSVVHQFEVPPFFAFHFGNAWQHGNSIHIEVASSADFHPLMDAITQAMLGKRTATPQSATQTLEIQLNLDVKRAYVQALPTTGIDFPRYDQRFTGQRTHQLFMLGRSDELPNEAFGFNTVTAYNRETESQSQFNYGPNTLAEEHIFVPAPGKPQGAGWLLGTSYNWEDCRTHFSVFNAESIQDGPISQVQLPYGLPMGLHGQFVAT